MPDKPVVKIEIDQEEVDMRKYVGDLQHMVEMQELAAAGGAPDGDSK